MRRVRTTIAGLLAVVGLVVPAVTAASPARTAPLAPVQIYGAWHCGDDYCTWGTVRNMMEFDRANHWLIDRGGAPR